MFILPHQGVKDFAEQQRRLQRDIANYLETNRDCARKLDEERRILEEKNRENARKLVEAAEDEVLSHLEDSGSYIPSGDSIHRPKLLFLPQMCPEHDLDSPVLGDQFIFESAANLASEPLTLNIPTGSDLLSPQYCPNPKATAKKIFSVTKVVSTSGMSQHSDTSSSLMSGLKFQNLGSTPSSVINSPTQVHPPIGRMGETDIMPVLPHLCAPLPSVNIENLNAPIPITVDLTNTSPNALQKVLEDHTLVSYIEQIVNSAPVLYEPSSSVENSQILTLETLPKKESTNGIESVPEGNGLSDNCNNLNNTSSVPDICDVNKTPSDVQPSETLCDKSESDRCEVSKCDTVGQEGETDIMTVECVRQCDTTGQENEENIVAVECKKVVGTLDTGASGDSTFIPDDNFDVTDIEVVDNEGNQCDMEDMDIVSSTETERENKNTPHSFESNGFCSDLIQEEPVKIAKPDVDDGNNSSSYNGDECFTSSLTTVPNSVCGSEQFSMNNDIELFENFEEDNILNGDFIDCSGNGLNDDSQNGETTEEITIDTNVGDTEPWNSLNESDFTEGSGLGVDIPASVVKPDFHSNLSFNGLKQELASLIDEETSIIGNGSVKTVKTRECEPNSHYGSVYFSHCLN
ncbi:hypothetical protein DPMN_086514 [Dreissena polymorpha]|uniref:Uncharacterized protein n=1 Tax=Dreissena polymorpha TaxID=45954 RepID=A0A9D4QV99_DREPO|nr:hypothetical protein DPMN_086514 [Dreissena polymorpha]